LKKISLPKASIGFLLLSLPLNFIAYSGMGNVYISTMLILLLFILLLGLVPDKLFVKKNPVYVVFIFALFILFTIINVFIDGWEGAKMQMVFTIIYLQSFLVFIIAYYAFERINIDFVFKSFILVGVLLSIRLAIEEPQNLFAFSTIRGERIEAYFAGAVNNFALLIGISLIICFFYVKNRLWKIFLSLIFFFVLALTMSRGALLGVILTFFLVSFYDTNTKTLRNLLNINLVLIIIGVTGLFYFDKMDVVLAALQERFLGLFTGEITMKQFSSGRGIILQDILKNHFSNSSFFQILFGHGMGSIDFSVNGAPYESSHNIFMDFAFRNGIIFLLFYMLFFVNTLLKFIRNRDKENLILFGIFIFLHFELLVNPYLFAVQMGWVYMFFMAAFISKLTLVNQKSSEKEIK
tara:strand:- start:3083 stop:4306 length:1224 start_codon:yes stop_codon:yes gene_type:complete